ncbi:MAG: hypothetical protein IMF09_06775 [Proteobacteria bacterium]|nr:hypothetical protein [Pseudomonadota bacterium]
MFKSIILIIALVLSASTWADDTSAAGDKPSLSATQKILMTATIEAINHETREVSLRGEGGKLIEIVASEDVRNLNQVKVGDTLEVEYIQSMSIQVFAATNTEAGAAGIQAGARSEAGEMPGVAALDTLIISAVVEEINLEANTFKLKGPDGEVSEFTARDPENLKKAAVGDLVIITLTEAMAITVQPKAGE